MIDTTYFVRCILALDKAYLYLQSYPEDALEFDIYRSSVIKEFEIVLEQSGKLLKKVLADYLHSNKAVDQLIFKDIFRQAGLHGLLSLDEVERWLLYRDNRNATSHDYGIDLANKTLVLMPQFVKDAKRLAEVIHAH